MSTPGAAAAETTPAAGGFRAGLAVFALAFAVRLVYLLQIRATPFFAHPVVDAKMYDDLAQQIAGGNLLGEGVFRQAPLYPYFLGLVYRLLGHDYFAARLVQIAVGSLSCCLVAAIGRRVFNPRVGLLAGLAAALCGTLVFYDAELLRPVLIGFLSLATLQCLIAAAERPTLARWAASGALLGIATITWEPVLLLLPAALLWLVHALRRQDRRPEILRSATCLCAALAAVVLPVTVRNYRVSGDVVIVSAWGGLNFYLGNSDAAGAGTAIQPGEEWDALVNLPASAAGVSRPSDQSRWFYARALRSIREQPLAWAGRLAKKSVLFWSAVEFEPNNDLPSYRAASPLFRALYQPDWPLVLPFGIVGPLALLGIALLPRREPKAWLLLAFVLAAMLALVLYHVRARYRIPVVPVLILFAAWAVDRLAAGFSGGWSLRGKAGAAAGLVALAGFVNVDFYDLRAAAPFPLQTTLGKIHLAEGRLEQAEAQFRAAVEKDPRDADALVNLGVIQERTGRGDEALASFLRAVRAQPGYAVAHNDIGVWHYARGHTREALAALRTAVSLKPSYADAHANLGVALLGQGELDQAEAEFTAAIRSEPRSARAHYLLGTVYRARKDFARAAASFRRALELNPRDAEAGKAYAEALGAAAGS